ncbi:MAG: hypothetical protein WBY94_14810 [Polyangiaceae bacterium]
MTSSPAVSAVATWFGTWSRPTDRPSQVALAIAAALLVLAAVPGGTGWLASMFEGTNVAAVARRRRFLMSAFFVAAFLSLGYIAVYLRGGPRAPEAAVYWLQGRALSHGAFTWIAPDPTANFRAGNLLFRAPDRLSGVFPPGYPLLLAMGFLVGAPMLVGPLVAASLVFATWLLACEIGANEGPAPPPGGPPSEAVARLAAGFSIVSAALRYHTADAVPYGASAAAVALCLACALRARRTGALRLFGGAGLSLGFLLASRPSSALAVGIVVAVVAMGVRGKRSAARAIAWSSGAAIPGLLLLLAANRAATGHTLTSAEAAYPSAIDIGAGVARLATPVISCLRDHLLDIANLEPLALLALVPLFVRPGRAVTLTTLVVAAETVVQLAIRGGPKPPDAGTQLVASLPLEHALMAFGVFCLFRRTFASGAVGTIAAAVAGFALHASHVHQALAASDDGHPRFDPDVVREANVTHGLLFFSDDVGYELAHDPGVVASHGIEAARLRGDDHDRWLFDSLGHPPSHRYVADAATASVPWWSPPSAGEAWRFEAESDWPPMSGTTGIAEVARVANPCASDGRVLRLTPTGPSVAASVTLALPFPNEPTDSAGTVSWIVTPRVLQAGEGAVGLLRLVEELGQTPLAEWSWNDSAKPASCADLPARTVELAKERARAWLILGAQGGAVMLDKTTILRGRSAGARR